VSRLSYEEKAIFNECVKELMNAEFAPLGDPTSPDPDD